MNRVKLLFIASSPVGVQQLRLERDLEGLQHGLETTGAAERFQIKTLWEPSLGHVVDALNTFQPQIFHFSGHGRRAGGLVLAAQDSGIETLSEANLLRLLRAVQKNAPRLAVFAACSTLSTAREVSRFVDCALGVSHEVADQVAWEFVHGFYAGIGAGRSVASAYEMGLARISQAVGLHHTFWLESRPTIDPREVTFGNGLAAASEIPLQHSLRLLDAGLSQNATKELEIYLTRAPSDGLAWYYLALAKLGRRRPAEISNLDEARRIVGILESAASHGLRSDGPLKWLGAVFLLRAWIQEDLFVRNHLASSDSNSLTELLDQSARFGAGRDELERLWRLIPGEWRGMSVPATIETMLRESPID